MPLTNEQNACKDAVIRWFKSSKDSRAPFFIIQALAGAGKTFCLIHIVQELGLKKVIYVSPTGKAALVMRGYGCANARTIHSLIYQPKGSSGDESASKKLHDALDKRENELEAMGLSGEDMLQDEELRKLRARLRALKDKPLFEKRAECDLTEADLLVLSEASMVTEGVARDLLSYGVPILCEGDPGQLPPIEGKPYFMRAARAENSFQLTQIHRQAEGSPILKLAQQARMTGHLDYGDYGDGCKVVRSLPLDEALTFSQIICGRNHTRHTKTWKIRQTLGFVPMNSTAKDEFLPRPKEKLICSRNDNDKGLLNGSFWTCDAAYEYDDHYLGIDMSSEDDGDSHRALMCHKELLTGPLQRKLPMWQARAKGVQHVDFGYVCTVHKFQGSQTPSVLLIDDWDRTDSRRQWLYTAVTRAQKKLVVLRED